jgi:hypothetical protein
MAEGGGREIVGVGGEAVEMSGVGFPPPIVGWLQRYATLNPLNWESTPVQKSETAWLG